MTREQYINPFFEIKVFSPDGKRQAALTEEIKRLIDSVQIYEVVQSEAGAQGSTKATISLKSGDYLPQQDNKIPIKEGRGVITNRANALLDLRFDSQKGFTYASKQEIEQGYTLSNRTQNGKEEDIIFIFAPKNIVEITWGYLQPYKVRTVRLKMAIVTAQGGGSGHGNTSIECFDPTVQLRQLTTSKGLKWINEQGQPLSLKVIMFKLAKMNGMDLVFNKEVVKTEPINETQYKEQLRKKGEDTGVQDPTAPEIWIKGLTWEEYVKELANKYQFYYEIRTTSDKLPLARPQLVFTSRSTRYNVAKPKFTFTYNSGDGILKTYQIRSAEIKSKKTAVSNVDNKNNKQVDQYHYEQLTTGDTKLAPIVDDKDLKKAEQQLGERLSKGLAGDAATHPSKDSRTLKALANKYVNDKAYPNLMNITTLGDPDFYPALVKIENIGVRYSTHYRMFAINHVLNNSGYTCQWNGKTEAVGSGGIKGDDEAKKNEETILEHLVDVNG